MPDGANLGGDAPPSTWNWSTSSTSSPPDDNSAPPSTWNWSTQAAPAQTPDESAAPPSSWNWSTEAPSTSTSQTSQPAASTSQPEAPYNPLYTPDFGTGAFLPPSTIDPFAAGFTNTLVSGAGSVAAGPGHIITGTSAQTGAAMEQAAVGQFQQARQQLSVMDRIDNGEHLTADQDPLGYQDMNPDQRAQARAQYTNLINQMPPPEQTGLYKAGQVVAATGKTVGEAIAAPGDWVNKEGQKITPPPGYEDSLSNLTGKALGTIPMILGSMWAGGLPAVVGVTGAQTYTDSYNDAVKKGAAPEDAAADAAIKAMSAAGFMVLPVTRWAESLSGAAKRAWAAVATRALVDGSIVTSVSQAQQLTNNVVDKAITEHDKSLTEGVGNPKEIVAQFVAGTVPGVAAKVLEPKPSGVSAGPAGGPEGAGEGAAAVAAEPQRGAAEVRGGEQGAEAGPAPGAGAPLPGEPAVETAAAAPPAGKPAAEAVAPAAPEPDQTKVASGITTPPAQAEGGTLVRTSDSAGESFIGHAHVLVPEGRNEDVDTAFQNAEQTQPVTQHEDKAATDQLLSSVHTNATEGITWTGRTEAPDGRAVVTGHDTEGNAIELPEEYYSVLSKYGDPAKDMYLSTRPGEPPLVAVRDPGTQKVVAVGVARPPLQEPYAEHQPGPTLEDRDAAINSNKPLPLPPEAQPLQDQLERINRNGPPPEGSPLADQAARLSQRIGQIVDSSYAQSNLASATRGPEAPPPDADEAIRLAQRRIPRTRLQPGVGEPDITPRPSLYRQAFRDAGRDPDVMVNRPITEQRDVLAQHMENATGFKVAVDPKMQPQKAVDSLLDGYRNVQWMAHALGYPLKVMSLNGKLHLNLEQFNPKKPYLGLYSYNPATGEHTIHMPDRSNSFAHEWTHALDHELATKLAFDPKARGALASARTRTGGIDLNAGRPTNSAEAFAHVMRAIFHNKGEEALRLMQLNAKAQGKGPAAAAAAAAAQRIVAGAKARIEGTEFAKAAKARDPYEKYLAMPEELLARAHEAYVAKQVAETGGTNEFITKGDANYLAGSSRRFAELYPQAEDRDNIFRAFQDLHAQVQREGVLGTGPAAARPGDYDMLDPVHWNTVGTPSTQPKVAGALRQAVQRSTNWWKRQLEGAAERAGVTGKAVELLPSGKSIRDIKDEVFAHIHSNMGQLDVFRARAEAAGNHQEARLISNMMDKLGWRYGEGRLQETPFLRLERQLSNQPINQVDNAMNRNGIPTSKVDLEAEHQLTMALRGRDAQGNTPQVPENIQKAASEIRPLLQKRWYDLERAGIDAGMPRDEGYFPIALDRPKILEDGNAAKVRFDRAMEADYDAKMRDSKSAFIHEAYQDLDRRTLDKSIHPQMDELARVQEAMRQEAAKPAPDQQVLAQLARQQSDLLAKVEPPIRDAWSKQRSQNIRNALEQEDIPWLKREKAGAPTSPLRSRVLSAEARDILMGDKAEDSYLISRPSEMLTHYFHVTGRRIAFARTFGPNGEVLNKFQEDLKNANVPVDERNEIYASTGSALGMLRNNELTTGHRISNWARTIATMSALGRAAYSSIHEPMLTAAQSGSHRAALQAFSTSMQSLMHDLRLTKGSEQVRHLSDIANHLGITSTRLQEAMLQGRTETLLAAPGRTMAAWYRRIGLTYVTNANKVGTIQGAHTAMQMWGRHIVEGQRGAMFDPHGEYRELGIPNAEHEQFAKWINSLNGMPTLDEIENSRMGRLWGQAVQRFMDKVVLEPTAAEKPRGANSALGRFVYSLMSYNYNFQRAVINPTLERRVKAVEYERERLGSKVAGSVSGNARWLAYTTAAIGAAWAAQLPVTMLRQEIFDHDRTNEWRKEGTYFENTLGLALQRLGLGGIADPVMNAFTGLRYQHDISSLAMGAAANYWVQALKDTVAPFFGAGSPNTNTAWYRSVRGMYQLAGMPLAALATALLPGGPKASWFLSLAGQYLTSMTAADQTAKLIAGPKGEKTNLTPEQREQEETTREEREAAQEARAEEQEPQQQEKGGGPSAGLLGLLDDFAMPLVKPAIRFGTAAARLVR